MKLVHLIMKRPEDDVSLSDGELFMVKRPPYAEHLAHAPQKQPVSSHKSIVHLSSDNLTNVKKSRCSNHRAQNNGNLHQKHLDSTGKGACTCKTWCISPTLCGRFSKRRVVDISDTMRKMMLFIE